MKCNFIWCIPILALLANACASQPEGSLLRDDEPVPQLTMLRDDDNIESFGKAVKEANSATTLAQSAKTETEWKEVATGWSKAIALMKSVPKNDPNYALAQQKITEYQKNIDEAQKKQKPLFHPKTNHFVLPDTSVIK